MNNVVKKVLNAYLNKLGLNSILTQMRLMLIMVLMLKKEKRKLKWKKED